MNPFKCIDITHGPKDSQLFYIIALASPFGAILILNWPTYVRLDSGLGMPLASSVYMLTSYNNPNGLTGINYFICSKYLHDQSDIHEHTFYQSLTSSGSNDTRGGCMNALVPGMSAADKNFTTPGICYR